MNILNNISAIFLNIGLGQEVIRILFTLNLRNDFKLMIKLLLKYWHRFDTFDVSNNRNKIMCVDRISVVAAKCNLFNMLLYKFWSKVASKKI